MALRKLSPIGIWLLQLLAVSVAPAARDLPTVSKWQRFELTLKSSVAYTNAWQEAEVRALFVSPSGQTNRVYGFWDGGKVWRVRFQPDFPGRWKFYTMCSDPTNSGLHDQAGEFICTVITGNSRFDQHGPVQVARSQRHLEHANRKPFLWLGDVAWDAAVQASPAEWNNYVTNRAQQEFNVVQWRLFSPGNAGSERVFRTADRQSLNLELFRQLDAKIATANRVGLLNAIAPLWELETDPEALPEADAIRLWRYVVARWGAEHIAWIAAFQTDSTGAAASRWQRIGRAVFHPITHAPVVLFPGESGWALDAFRGERWVQLLGLQTSQITNAEWLPWLWSGPLTQERFKQPVRPLINLLPASSPATAAAPLAALDDFSRQCLWWNLLLNTPAGVSHHSTAIAQWNQTARATFSTTTAASAPQPTAPTMRPLARLAEQPGFWNLHPLPSTALTGRELESAANFLAQVASDTPPVTVIYTTRPAPLNVTGPLAHATNLASWWNPRTGEQFPATRVDALPFSQRFTPPGPGDWLLLLRGRN